MKTMCLVGAVIAAVAMISGCASTDYRTEARIDPNARWIVVSTNEPVSSAAVERKSSRVPASSPSILLSPDSQEARQEIENSGIPPVLKKRMLDGEVLTLADIEDLGRYKISEATILKYLRASGAIYILKTEDINRLQQAGVSKEVTDYMLASVNQRPVQVVKRYYRNYHYYDPWWDYPRYHYYYPYYHNHHYHHHGHRGHHGGGLRVYRGR